MKHLLAVAACAALAGCHPPASSVEQDWAEAIARLDYIAIYPITEDLQPGDVLLSIPSKGGQPQPTVQRLGSIPKDAILRAMTSQETGRIAMQGKTVPADATQGGAKASSGTNVTLSATYTGAANVSTQVKVDPVVGPAAKPATAGKKPPVQNADAPIKPEVIASDSTQMEGKPLVPRLRRVSVPMVAAARVYSGDIGAGGSVGSLGIGAALGLRGDVAVSIYLKDLESLGADSLRALDELETARHRWLVANRMSAPRLLSIARRADQALGQRLCLGKPRVRGEARALIQVVNQVLYAHSIQFEYQRGSSFAGKLALDFAKSVSAAQGTVPTLAAASTTPATAAPSAAATADTAAAEAAARLAALSSGLTLPSSPGVRTSLGVGSSGEVALTDTFSQPMAVGFSQASSYTVRGSLLYVADNPVDAEGQAALMDVMCAPDAPSVPAGRISPISALVCSNTNAYNTSSADKFALPNRCFADPAKRSLRPEVMGVVSEAMTQITNN